MTVPESVPFELKLQLASPVILPFMTTLDGLLSYAAEAMTGERGDALVPHIPLEVDADTGIFKASSIFLGPDVRHVRRVKVRSLKTDSDLNADFIAPKRMKSGKIAKSPYPKLDKQRGDYANKLTNYAAVEASTATCWGVGRPDEVMLLLELVMGLGKHSRQGQGEIVGRSIREVPDDRSWITRDGQPARALPVEIWSRVSGTPMENVAQGLHATRFPYWESDWEECVMPKSVIMQ